MHEGSNPFESLADTPEEAADLLARAELMIDVRQQVEGIPIADVLNLLGIDAKRWGDLEAMLVDEFTLPELKALRLASLGAIDYRRREHFQGEGLRRSVVRGVMRAI